MKEESRNWRSSAWLGRAGWTRSSLTIGVLSGPTPATAQGNTVIDLTYDFGDGDGVHPNSVRASRFITISKSRCRVITLFREP